MFKRGQHVRLKGTSRIYEVLEACPTKRGTPQELPGRCYRLRNGEGHESFWFEKQLEGL